MNSVELLLKDLSHSRLGTRVRAARELGRSGDPAAIPPLIDALRDENPRIRDEAVQALGKLGPAAVRPLRRLLRDEDHRVRVRAIEALGRIGDDRAAPALARALLEPQTQRCMDEIAEAFTRIGDGAVRPLCRLLEHPAAEARSNAVEVLIRIAAENPGPRLRAALPLLRQRLTPWKEPGAIRRRVEDAIHAIEAMGSAVEELPLPAAAPAPGSDVLPLPAEAPER